MNPIWLRREGDHVIVAVEIDGRWVEVIREFVKAPFSHIWEGRYPSPPVTAPPQTGAP